jgi:hypothetical protein
VLSACSFAIWPNGHVEMMRGRTGAVVVSGVPAHDPIVSRAAREAMRAAAGETR